MKTRFQKIGDTFNLTSVKIISPEYKIFKSKCIETGISLQEFVNACICIYNSNNNGFDTLIHRTIMSGSIYV